MNAPTRGTPLPTRAEACGVERATIRDFVELTLNPMSLAIIGHALDLGIIEALASGPRAPGSLAEAVGLAADSVSLEMTLELGAELGLFVRAGDGFGLGELSRLFLSRTSSLRLLGLVEHYRAYVPSASSLPEALRSTPRSRRTMWRQGAERAEHERYFAARQAYNESRRGYFSDTAYLLLRGHMGLSTAYALGSRRRACDVGAGPGAFACLLKKSFPAIDSIAVDVSFRFPEYRERSYAMAAAEGLEVSFRGDNALFDPLPAGIDLLTFNRLISGVPRDGADAWLSRAFDALEPGGVLAMVDMVMSDDPVHDRLVSLVVSQWMAKDRYVIAREPPTSADDDKHQWGWSRPWRATELRRRMEEHGFVDTFHAAADPPFTLVGGIKP